MRGRQVFRFCFDESDGDGLGIGIDLDTKDIIYPPFRLFSRLTVNDFDSPGSLLPANEVLGPPTAVERRVDELGTGIGFAQGRRGFPSHTQLTTQFNGYYLIPTHPSFATGQSDRGPDTLPFPPCAIS